MGRAALKPSAAVGRLLRHRRKELHLTLVEVADRLERDGERIPVSTLARIERGALDPGIPRLHRLLRLYRIRPHLLADLMDLEGLAVQPPVGKDLETLIEDGRRYWEQGDTAQGLAHLFAVRERVPADPAARLLRQKATLAFAIFARGLGKSELAHQLVDDLLREPPDPSILLHVLVLAASVWRGLGSLAAALAFQARAELEVDPGDPRQVAWVFHEKGKLLSAAGQHVAAGEALERAVEAYRAAADPYGESKALLAKVGALAAAGRFLDALEVARHVLSRSESLGHAQVELAARIEIGRNLVASGSAEEGLDALAAALAKAMMLKDRHGQFLAHYCRFKAYEAVGDLDRAALELEFARYFVRFVDEAMPEADEVRSALDTGAPHGAKRRNPPPSKRSSAG